ncbi:MAG: hypothetical protein AAGD09_04655 [Cyanobacteria bacterium P01_F01_bin.56]
MSNSQLLAQARAGNAIAIAKLLNLSLQPQGILARVEPLDRGLRIALEAPQVPPVEQMEQRLRVGLEKLQPQGITSVIMQGFALGASQPTWTQQIFLTTTGEAHPATGRSPATNSPPLTMPPHAPADLSGSTPPEPLSQAVMTGSKPSQPHRRPSQPPARPSSQPFVLKWEDFEPMMLAIIGFIAIYGFLGARNPSYDGPFMWLHYPDLAIHETGHLLFMPFGHFLMLLGGSVTQIAFPAVFTGYFYCTQQYFSSALTLFWTGQNFMDVAVYMADAPHRVLPLTNPDINAHDWWQLFNMMNCLQNAEFIAGVTHWLGVLLYVASVIAGVYVAYQHQQEMNQRQRV